MQKEKTSLIVQVYRLCLLPVVVGVVAGATLVVAPSPAGALPSFARQTNQPCGACHVDFPQLTPYGRRFKLYGYTAVGGTNKMLGEPGWVPPVSGQLITSYTRTEASQNNATVSSKVRTNDNLIFQEGSVWYGGALTEHIGLMVQADYINPVTPGFGQAKHSYNWDMLDLRFADAATRGNVDIVYGLSLNNQPGVQDSWNSVPAWNFPFLASTLAPTPAAKTLIEGAFTQRVLGAGGYLFINDMLYFEASGYRTLSQNRQNSLGIDPMGAPGLIDGLAPYFRVALEPHWGNHWLEVGAYSFRPNINPQPWNFFGTNPLTGLPAGKDRFTDVGLDAQYQYQGGNYWITVRGSYIHENQKLNASSSLPIDPTGTFSSNATNRLNSAKVSASLAYGANNIVVLTGSYFNINGSSDVALYGPGTMANSANASPNSNGWIAEAAYIPFGTKSPDGYPWVNARVGLQYIRYNKFNGAGTNYDGMGTNASANNTVFLYGQIAF